MSVCVGLRTSPVEASAPRGRSSAQEALRWITLIPIAILASGSFPLKAGNVTWTLNVTFTDGGTASGVFTFNADTSNISNWNITTSGGNTSVYPVFDFTPTNSFISFNGSSPSAPVIGFNSNASFPDVAAGGPEHLVLSAAFAAPLTDAGGSINILPGTAGASSYECLNCYPARFITNGTATGQPAPDLSIAVTDNSTPSYPAGSPFTQGQGGAMYTITVSNVGSAPTLGTVTVTNSLTAGSSAASIDGPGWTCVLATLNCSRGDPLTASASYPVISIAVTIPAGAPGGVTDTASVSGGGETNATNDTAGDYTTTFTETQLTQAWSYMDPPVSPDAALLMTDGTIMAHQFCSSNWYKLTPDNFGGYANGTWSQAASMQPAYAPFAFASAVLADGRLVVIGGEYNGNCGENASPAETNLGAIYDPAGNVWTPLSAPSGWTAIGDATSVVLPDGQLLLAGNFNSEAALLDPATLTWTNLSGAPPTEEAGWTLLPDGSVLMPGVATAPGSYRYLPQTNTWLQAGNTVAALVTGNEIGPQVLQPDGIVFVAGATGQTALYNVAAGTWSAGPSFPGSGTGLLVSDDVSGSLLPNGNVLVQAYNSQSEFFFEFDGTNLNPVPGTYGCMGLLVLPNGQISCSGVFLYTPTGSANAAWAPTIATAPNVVQPGLTYAITGTQFNGLSQAVAFGDDYQGATNYPLVRITNTATGHVFYCRTHNHSTMGVATGAALVSTQFDVPPSIETGPSTLVVAANGIPSSPFAMTVSYGQTQYQLTISAAPAAGGTVIPASGVYDYDSGTAAPIIATANSGYGFAGWTGNVANASSASTTVTMGGPRTVTANFALLTAITIQTNPAGLQFSVDGGTAQTAPQTLNLTQVAHTIAVAATQAGAAGTQYVFSGWSDSGAASHSITVGASTATYTASFQTQYQLTTAASPTQGGTVTPASGGFYNAGTVVPITATANAGYGFSGWTGTVANAASASTSVTMSAAESTTANFRVLMSQSITFGTLPNQAIGAAPFAVSATASSGLAVGFASTTLSVCTVSSATVTLVTVGACTVEATQAGNNTYAAAAAVDETFQVQYSPCDLKQSGSISVSDVQLIINEALGVIPVVYDLSGTGVVNVVDVQIEINAALGLGCAAK